MTLRDTADQIIRASLRAVQPDAAVQRALQEFSCAGRVVLIAIGKAAWAMANAAWDTLSTRITSGAVITKYGHSRGPIGPLQIFEAGHPVPDEAGLRAAQAALELTRGLREEDCVLFLISGGGSALFGSSAIGGTINVITKEPSRNSAQMSHTLTSIGGSNSYDNNTMLNASLVTESGCTAVRRRSSRSCCRIFSATRST